MAHRAGGGGLSVDAPRPLLGELDAWLLAEGTHLRPYEVLGAHPAQVAGVAGCRFALWAPNARAVSVVGDFNAWQPGVNALGLDPGCGVWSGFVAAALPGAAYKFAIQEAQGAWGTWRADPYAHCAELRPANASRIHPLPALRAPAGPPHASADVAAPISIYEVHTPSWRRVVEQGDRWLNWDELADHLVPYAADLGFTHIELLPVSEHPLDASWGYQPIGLYAPTARHGDPEGLARLIARAHAAGLGVILDWVPAHFPSDAHGLARLDGTALYEHQDPREGYHPDWNTLIYNLGRREVANFLLGNALYWIERYGADGLRVDAVASMLYRDYSRAAGQWLPNVHGGRENLEAIAFLQRFNHMLGAQCPQAFTVAEESTAFAGVTRPVHAGGLGFHYKWNMGWMHDTLRYFARDPVHRSHHHNDLTFGLTYAHSEQFVLPLSHDEVVHGKGSLWAKMPGDAWQRAANLRALYACMWAHPGKKLLFMGGEFGQQREWAHTRSLDWHELADPLHAGLQRLVRDLNHALREQPALHQCDTQPEGFAWVCVDDAAHSVYAWLRWDAARRAPLLVLANLTPVVRSGYRVGVPCAGAWRERLNTDAACYGGSNVGHAGCPVLSEPVAWQGQAHSLVLTLAPLAVQWWVLA